MRTTLLNIHYRLLLLDQLPLLSETSAYEVIDKITDKAYEDGFNCYAQGLRRCPRLDTL